MYIHTHIKADVSDSILERVEFKGDDTDMHTNPLTKATLAFLQSHNTNCITTTISDYSSNYSVVAVQSPPLIISLSGGK